jgi:hypothetical protein
MARGVLPSSRHPHVMAPGRTREFIADPFNSRNALLSIISYVIGTKPPSILFLCLFFNGGISRSQRAFLLRAIISVYFALIASSPGAGALCSQNPTL